MKKIIDVLGKTQENIKLDVFVDEKTGKIVSLADKPGIKDLDEKELNKIVEKANINILMPTFENIKQYRAWITNNISNYIDIMDKLYLEKYAKFTFELTQPPYSVISQALSQFNVIGEKIDTISGGRVIFDSCYLNNQGDLTEIMKIPDLYAALCLKCSELIDLVYVEYKKK